MKTDTWGYWDEACYRLHYNGEMTFRAGRAVVGFCYGVLAKLMPGPAVIRSRCQITTVWAVAARPNAV